MTSHTMTKRRSTLTVSALAIAAFMATFVAAPDALSADVQTGSASAAQTVTTATLTINVTGFIEEAGTVQIVLTDEAGYQAGKAVRGTLAAVDADRLTVTFENVPLGTYALRMFHDVDNNDQLNANAFGIPTEPFAFSNNAKGVMGPAKWSEAQFELGSAGATQNISF